MTDTVTSDALLQTLQLLRGKDERDELERRGDLVPALRASHGVYHMALNFFGKRGPSELGCGAYGPELYRKVKAMCASADGQATQLGAQLPTQLNNRIIQGVLLGSYTSSASDSTSLAQPR